MVLVVISAVVLFGIEFYNLYDLRQEAKELEAEINECYIEDTYVYRFVSSDYRSIPVIHK